MQGVDEELGPAHARVTRWMDNGVRPVFELRLRNGTRIKATGNHEFLSESGWTRLDALQPGDFIGTPQKLSLAREGRYVGERERARLHVLAYLLGDGSLSQALPTFYSSDVALLTSFEDSCRLGFQNVSFRHGARCPRRDPAERFQGSIDGRRVSRLLGLEHWLRGLELRWRQSDERALGSVRKGPRSHEKWIPEHVFELAEEEIARFLAAMWDCDGYVGARSVFYKTISRQLAVDVQTLLLRLGIRSSVYESDYEAKAGRRTAYQVTPRGSCRFATLIQPHMVTSKREVLTRAQDTSVTVDRTSYSASSR